MNGPHSIETRVNPPDGPAATGNYAPSGDAAELVRLLDQYLADLQAGRAPDRDRLLAEHPDLAAQLEQCLSGIEFVHRAAQPGGDTPAQLGDFRIVREIGRGGMGVVYEAEQLSLHRPVALKVLRCGAVADPEAMQRFQREAETVARLHHTNIVPIFAVGCEQGVHYYAMQLIDGRSLASVLDETKGGLDPYEIARLGLQAAEALAHAHQRGVIHRDVMPSNLLLDREGTLWLTDFGLARRLDEVTLTVTGMLMGTPRYMSPEQAAAAKQPVDHRTDVYSLGATLYELATGKPVFTADTPQAIVAQILVDEPAAPRRLREELPRDSETIVLKCLAKEPARRYPTAQALADDLRAFLDGRPIRARRPSLAERAARWARKHRRSAGLMAATAVVAVALMAAGLVGLERYRQWRTGRLFLTTDGPVLAGEILDEAGRRVQERFTVPTTESLSLPAGPYQLRLRGRGYLDETLQLNVERGKELSYNVNLEDQRLWEPLAVERTYECVQAGNRHDLLFLSGTGLTRRHGGTGAVLWTANLRPTGDPKLAGVRWDWDTQARPSGRNELDRRPRLLQPAPDLDGDGTPDLVWASRRQPAVLALSGKDGRVLWCFHRPPQTPERNSRYGLPTASTGTVLGLATLPDVDGDGVPDLVGTFAAQPPADGRVPCWVEALSGRTGQSLWRHDLDPRWLAPPPGDIPFEAYWNNEQGLSLSVGGGGGWVPSQLYEHEWMQPRMGVPVPYAAQVVSVEGRPVVVLTAGTRLIGLDPRTGGPAWPAHDLGFWPLRPPQFADLDGHADVLLVGPGNGSETGNPVPEDRLELMALALSSRRTLWRAPFRGYWGWNWMQEPFDWPVLADLDGDGRPEVMVPTGDFEAGTRWSGVQVLDGATGAVRWLRKLSRSRLPVQQVNRILVGSAPGADGCRPIFTAVPDGDYTPVGQRSFLTGLDKDYSRPVLVLDALSGKDGHSLWWARQPVPSGSLMNTPKPGVGRLHWGPAGADGWPQLVVPYVPGWPDDRGLRFPVYFVSSGTGRVLQVGADYRELRILDLDGDGVPDLLAFRPDRPTAFDGGGKLEAVRGQSPEAWRRLGGAWQPAGDLDGDGVPDLVSAELPGDVRRAGLQERERDDAGADTRHLAAPPSVQSKALSGRDGHVLWQRTLNDSRPHPAREVTVYQHLHPLGPADDLDNDGVPDLLVTPGLDLSSEPFAPLLAVSGRTGERLWEADLLVHVWHEPAVLECRDLDGDGKPEVVLVAATDWGWPRPPGSGLSSGEWQYRLVVLSGRDGKVRWKQPLCDRATPSDHVAAAPLSCVLADLDGDGLADVIVQAGKPDDVGEVRAFRGKDGTPLWRWLSDSPKMTNRRNSQAGRPTLAVGDLDGDGRPEVVVLHTVDAPDAKGRAVRHAEVVALDGASGQPKWTWREPVNYDYNDDTNGAIHSRATPLLVNLDGGPRRAVCVWTSHHQRGDHIVLLDAAGKELLRRRVRFRLSGEMWKSARGHPQNNFSAYYGSLFRVWAVDLDGDGRDELVYFDAEKLCVLRGGLEQPQYEWPLPDEECDLLQVAPRTEQHPPLVVVRAGGRVVFLGTSPEKPAWTCSGSGKPVAVTWAPDGPRVLYDLGNEVTVCRLAEPDQAATTATVSPHGDDPRLVVPLPWQSLAVPPPLPSSPFGLAAALLAISLAVLVLPGALLLRAVRRRAWILCPLAALWLGPVWGGAYLLATARMDDEAPWVLDDMVRKLGAWGTVGLVGLGLLVLAVAGLPLAAFVRAAVGWARRRRGPGGKSIPCPSPPPRWPACSTPCVGATPPRRRRFSSVTSPGCVSSPGCSLTAGSRASSTPRTSCS